MIRRQTWFILGLFVVLLAGTLFWQQTKQKNAPEETATVATPDQEENLFDPTGAGISYVKIQRVEDGTTLEMEKRAEGWELLLPKAWATESSTIESAITSLFSARIVAKPTGATDLTVLGLQPPVYRVQIGLENGQKITMNIGKAAGAGTGYYVLTDARVVYIVNKFSLDALIGMVDTPPIMPTPTLEPTPEPTLEATVEATEAQSATPTP